MNKKSLVKFEWSNSIGPEDLKKVEDLHSLKHLLPWARKVTFFDPGQEENDFLYGLWLIVDLLQEPQNDTKFVALLELHNLIIETKPARVYAPSSSFEWTFLQVMLILQSTKINSDFRLMGRATDGLSTIRYFSDGRFVTASVDSHDIANKKYHIIFDEFLK